MDITLLGLGAMGTALARSWLAAGHALTVWNRTPARAEPLAGLGARVVGTPSEISDRLVVACLLDDASVRETLADVDLNGKDLVNLTTGTPGQARALAGRAASRGARFLAGGIMAIPPMIGSPAAYVFYSGSRPLFEDHRAVLEVPADTVYVGDDPGHAALHDVALLSAMTGMLAGVAHAFALIRKEDISPVELAPRLAAWLMAMSSSVHTTAKQLETGDYTTGVTANLAMQVTGSATLLRTAAEQGVSPELITPFLSLMQLRLDDGYPDEDTTGVIDLLTGR